MPGDLEVSGFRYALSLLALPVFGLLAAGAAYGAEECISDNPAITAMRPAWNRPLPVAPETARLNGAFDAVLATLQPYETAAARYGKLALKAKKDVKYFAPFMWTVPQEGDYWIAADSGVWIDVFGANEQALEPVTFNHGLRCAGIFKSLKFHLTAGTYRLVIASETTDSVKFAVKKDGGNQPH